MLELKESVNVNKQSSLVLLWGIVFFLLCMPKVDKFYTYLIPSLLFSISSYHSFEIAFEKIMKESLALLLSPFVPLLSFYLSRIY